MKGAREARERLLTYGTRPLSDEDLLGSLGVPTDVVARVGGLRAAASMDPPDLACLIGHVRAERFLAALELGRRVLATPEHRPRLTSPAAIAAYLNPTMAGLRREEFRVLCLNSRSTLIRDVRVAEGTIESCPVDPREVFAPAVACRASGIAVAHNHPSGDPTPSQPDILLTRHLREGASLLSVSLLDHVIIGEAGTFYSMAERGHLQP